jgi:hypothetical protein
VCDGRIEEPLRISVGLIAMVALACFVSAAALASNICGMFDMPIWLSVAFGLVVLVVLARALHATPSEARSWRGSCDRWDVAEIGSFVSFGLLAWTRRTGGWSFNLPSSQSVDMVHHLALADYLSRTGQLPKGMISYLGPMVGYPPGAHILAAFVQWIGRSEITSALTFTAWWMCIAWGFFIGGIARLAIGERSRWIGVAAFPALCLVSEFLLGQVTEQFYFAQVIGGFVLLAIVVLLCLRSGALIAKRSSVSSTDNGVRERWMFRAAAMLLLAGLPAIYPLALFSAGAIVGCVWLCCLLVQLMAERSQPETADQRFDFQIAQPAKRDPGRFRCFDGRTTVEFGWLLAGALLGVGLWLPSGLNTSNTMISQEGGLAAPTLTNFGGPVTLALGLVGLVWLGSRTKKSHAEPLQAGLRAGWIVVASLFAIVAQISGLSIGKALGLPITRYYVLKGMYFAVPLLIVLVLCGFACCFHVLVIGVKRAFGARNLTSKGPPSLKTSKMATGIAMLASGLLIDTAPLRVRPLQASSRRFDGDLVELARQARSKLPEQRIAVVADPATSYLVWNAIFRQQRTDDPLETFDSFAKTNRWADWPTNGSEHYLLTTNALAEQYLNIEGVRVAGIRGDAVLLSGEAQGRVRRVTHGPLALPPRGDPIVVVTPALRKAFPRTVNYVEPFESTTNIRKLLGMASGTSSLPFDRFATEDEFRLAAMSRSQAVPLAAVLFAEALRIGQFDDGVTAAITELVAVTQGDLTEFVSEGAIDPAAMFAWASVSPNKRLIPWRSHYVSLASATAKPHGSIVWGALDSTVVLTATSDNESAIIRAAQLCGARPTPRRTLALRALSTTLAHRSDLQRSFGTPKNPKLRELIMWVRAGSDSDASKLLPYWPEVEAIAAACNK